MKYILGIESSCDDSSLAIVDSSFKVITSVTRSHLECLKPYQGVMPEVVSREHCRILPTLLECLQEKFPLEHLDAIAYTSGPGLAGSLLIGSHVAQTLSLMLRKSLVPIHHLEGHLLASLIENEDPFETGPVLGLIVSGGHTQFVLMPQRFQYEIIGQTRDDAAGEAFDKIAKSIGLGYPGGPVLAKIAATCPLPRPNLFSIPLQHVDSLDLSFSGLKTQASRFIYIDHGYTQQQYCAAVEEAITTALALKTRLALKKHPQVQSFILCGGVACNTTLRRKIQEICDTHGIRLIIPSPDLCTDNGSMIAAAGHYHFQHQGPALSRRPGVFPQWTLGTEIKDELN